MYQNGSPRLEAKQATMKPSVFGITDASAVYTQAHLQPAVGGVVQGRGLLGTRPAQTAHKESSRHAVTMATRDPSATVILGDSWLSDGSCSAGVPRCRLCKGSGDGESEACFLYSGSNEGWLQGCSPSVVSGSPYMGHIPPALTFKSVRLHTHTEPGPAVAERT